MSTEQLQTICGFIIDENKKRGSCSSKAVLTEDDVSGTNEDDDDDDDIDDDFMDMEDIKAVVGGACAFRSEPIYIYIYDTEWCIMSIPYYTLLDKLVHSLTLLW